MYDIVVKRIILEIEEIIHDFICIIRYDYIYMKLKNNLDF
tara:strand:- start:4268 stop:4387 length:120 start_codon:yes stop_codon:yes gene_type:complete